MGKKRMFKSMAAAEEAYLAMGEVAARLDMAWRDEVMRNDPDELVWGKAFIVEAYRLEHPTGGYVVVKDRSMPDRASAFSCHNAEEWVARVRKAGASAPIDLMSAATKIWLFWEALKEGPTRKSG